ncbi:MAG: class I SAM-dependent methyltransferase [Anaerolineales bacterium]
MSSDLDALDNSHSPSSFDYESKLWGDSEVSPTPRYLGGLRLEYCLSDLSNVTGCVLELGCGGGAMARAIKRARPDLDVFACDISQSAIRAAKMLGDDVLYFQGDASNLPAFSEQFDAVVILDVLEHLPRPEDALNEIQRVLRKNGIVHLFVPCEGQLQTLHGVLTHFGWRAKEIYAGHIQRFAKADLESLLLDIGFSTRDHRWSGHFVNQIADVGYFTWLSLRSKPISTSVEGHLDHAPDSGLNLLLKNAKLLVSILSYYESKLLSWFPGFGLHLVFELRRDA